MNNYFDIIKRWGWIDEKAIPLWLESLAQDYFYIYEKNLKLGEILLLRNVLSESEFERAFSTKPATKLTADHLKDFYPNNTRLHAELLPAITATAAVILPYFKTLDLEGIEICPQMFDNAKFHEECEREGLIVILLNSTPVVIFSSYDDYSLFCSNDTFESAKSLIHSSFDVDVKYGFTSAENISKTINISQNSEKNEDGNETFVIKEFELDRTGDTAHVKLKGIFNACISNRASDLHIVPSAKGDKVEVKIRVHTKLGMLSIEHQLELSEYYTLRDYLNVRSQATRDGHAIFEPVDGQALTYLTKSGMKSRLRPAFMPLGLDMSVDTALVRIVLRFSDFEAKIKALNELRFDPEPLEHLYKAMKMKGKMIIMVGAVGTGKTTTMYSLLNEYIEHNNNTMSALTIEDPIEQLIPNVNQTQISFKARQHENSYAYYMKHIVRHDVNCLYLGEIRDHDTAVGAANFSALGNKLMATIHGDDEVTGIERLMSMMRRSDDQYLLINNLGYIFSQRLLPLLCQECAIDVSIDDIKGEIEEWIEDSSCVGNYNLHDPSHSFKAENPKGCSHCGYRGVVGVKPVLGVLKVTKEIKTILQTQDSDKFNKVAKLRQFSLVDQVVSQVLTGTASYTALNV